MVRSNSSLQPSFALVVGEEPLAEQAALDGAELPLHEEPDFLPQLKPRDHGVWPPSRLR